MTYKLNSHQTSELAKFKVAESYVIANARKVNSCYNSADQLLFKSLEYGTREEITRKAKQEYKYRQEKEYYFAAMSACQTLSSIWEQLYEKPISRNAESVLKTLYSLLAFLNVQEMTDFVLEKLKNIEGIESSVICDLRTEVQVAYYVNQYSQHVFMSDRAQNNISTLFPIPETEVDLDYKPTFEQNHVPSNDNDNNEEK